MTNTPMLADKGIDRAKPPMSAMSTADVAHVGIQYIPRHSKHQKQNHGDHSQVQPDCAVGQNDVESDCPT